MNAMPYVQKQPVIGITPAMIKKTWPISSNVMEKI